METRLTRFIDGMMEIIWLAVVILTPLFFNIYSSRIFEPDKITLLRTLSLILLFAWIVKLVDSKSVVRTIRENNNLFHFIKVIPLLPVVLFLLFVYIVATFFSITPATSLWGSYQRLQGTYTTFSYVVIFIVLLGNLRRRAQIERIITAIIIASLPVSLYGVLQRYKIDPIPWGGDTSARIASNLGNSIFVAAYLIMVVPLVIGRILVSFREILQDTGSLLSNFTRATIYVFIGSLQIIAIYFSGSRGPTLGFLTGGFILFLILVLLWGKRSLIIGVIFTAFIGASFLIVLNIKGGPLENLRNSPGIGRFGQLLDPQSNNARVREYIWKGTVRLVAPHKPLEYPDGRLDIFNSIRPVIGYGPESMYVAYNSFYPPELTQVEKRNASPDRSHNETWDSLVTTGILGLIAYLLLFGFVVYYGFKWLGLIVDEGQKKLFVGLFILCGVISSLFFIYFRDISYFGVALPFGMVVGAILYLAIIALHGVSIYPNNDVELNKSILLAVLISAIIAHWLEINFGIAIVVTRLYFWVFAALLILLGFVLPNVSGVQYLKPQDENSAVITDPPKKAVKKSTQRKKRRPSGKRSPDNGRVIPVWVWEGMSSGVILAILLSTLGYEFISSSQGGGSALAVLWNSLTKLKNIYSGISYGVLAMVITSWIAGALLFTSESQTASDKSTWIKQLGVVIGTSILLAGMYWLWHSYTIAKLLVIQPSNLSEVLKQVQRYEGLLTIFYISIILLVLVGTYIQNKLSGNRSFAQSSWQSILALTLSIFFIPFLVVTTNLRVIQADIAFKLAEPFNNEKSWPVAIEIYKHAIDLAPSEDYYYLFLGRAYLENAKVIQDPTQRDALISNAEKDLKTAQEINPLNTDHTANLARLYSLWSVMATDADQTRQRAEISSEYFSKAITLSPQNTRIWDEWALLELNSLANPQQAYDKLIHSEELDPYYDWTQALLGEYYIKIADNSSDPSKKAEALDQALFHYGEAKRLTDDNSARANYSLAQAQLAINTQQYTTAISALNEVVLFNPGSSDLWKYEQTLAQLYAQVGDKVNAFTSANKALQAAPDDQKANIENLINQIKVLP